MTEAKKAQEALLDSERMARTIIDTALDAIIQVNECGEVLEWNPRAESILGWSRQEAMGRPITDLYLPKGYRPRYLTMNELLQQVGRVEGERFEIDVVRKDGRKIRAEISMTGVRRHGGNVTTCCCGTSARKFARRRGCGELAEERPSDPPYAGGRMPRSRRSRYFFSFKLLSSAVSSGKG
jgi:PAS domain S-box-containing protein